LYPFCRPKSQLGADWIRAPLAPETERFRAERLPVASACLRAASACLSRGRRRTAPIAPLPAQVSGFRFRRRVKVFPLELGWRGGERAKLCLPLQGPLLFCVQSRGSLVHLLNVNSGAAASAGHERAGGGGGGQLAGPKVN